MTGHCPAVLRIERFVAVACAMGDPTRATAIGDRHREPARRDHVPQWGPLGDRRQRGKQIVFEGQRLSAQQDRALDHRLAIGCAS
jgi:hypothetical protein